MKRILGAINVWLGQNKPHFHLPSPGVIWDSESNVWPDSESSTSLREGPRQLRKWVLTLLLSLYPLLPLSAQTWYLRHDLTQMAPPRTFPPAYINVDTVGCQASFAVPGRGVTLTAQWRMPATITTNGTALPVSVQVAGPSPMYSAGSGWGPSLTVVAVGYDAYPDTVVDNGYGSSYWDSALHTNVFPRGGSPYAPSGTHFLEGPNPVWDSITYEVQVSGWNWAEFSTDEVNVFYTYTRDPTPAGDYLVLVSSSPASGDGVPFDQPASFRASVQYRLQSRPSATIGMYVYDQNGTVIAETTNFVGVVNGSALGTAALFTPVVSVPSNSSNLLMVAYFVDDGTSTVFLRSNTNQFPIVRAMELELGTQNGGTFTPLGSEASRRLYGGLMFKEQPYKFQDARVTQLPDLLSDDVLDIWLHEEDTWNGMVLAATRVGSRTLTAGVQPAEILVPLNLPQRVTAGRDLWTLTATLQKQGQIANLVYVPVQYVAITGMTPLKEQPLRADATNVVEFRIRYNVEAPGPLDMVLNYDVLQTHSSTAVHGQVVPLTGLVKGMSGYTNVAANAYVPPEPLLVYFTLMLGEAGEATSYRAFSDGPYTLPPSPAATTSFEGGQVKTVANGVARTFNVESLGRSYSALRAGESAGSPLAVPPLGFVRPQDFLGLHACWGFDPPISTNAGFLADLTLNWRTNDLPDDPNFDINRLVMVSWNAGDACLRLYPTSLNLASNAATARVSGLDRYYTLGVPGPFAWRTLNLVALGTRSGVAAEARIVNPGAAAETFNLTPFTESGTQATNPVAVTVPARATSAGPLAPRFGLGSFRFGDWVQTRAEDTSGAAAGLELQDGQRREVMCAPTPPAPRLVAPVVAMGNYVQTELHLVNPTVFDANVTVTLHRTNGTILATSDFSLPAKGKRAAALTELFPLVPNLSDGVYVIVDADTEVSGMALLMRDAEEAVGGLPFGPPGYFAAIAGLTTASGSDADALRLPGVSAGVFDLASRLALVNAGTESAAVSVLGLNDTGTVVGGPVAFALAAGQRQQFEITEVFGWDAWSETNCTLVVTGQVGMVVGAVDYADAFGFDRFRTVLPLQRTPSVGEVFPLIPGGTNVFTHLAVHNSGAVTTRVAVAVFRTNGVQISATRLSLPPGGTARRTLEEWASTASGAEPLYVTVAGEMPVCAAGVSADANLEWMSALPGVPWDAASWQPQLRIEKRPAGVGLLWPLAETGFAVQTAESFLPTAAWTNLLTTPSVEGNEHLIIDQPSNGVRFYRLVAP